MNLEVVDNIYHLKIDKDQQNVGINKEGLVTNRTKLGEIEEDRIIENIFH